MKNNNPNLNLISVKLAYQHIEDYQKNHSAPLQLLHIGAGKKSNPKFMQGYEVTRTDYYAGASDTLQLDACKPFPMKTNTYDVVFSFNVFEHLYAPWTTADECVRICKLGGLNVHIAPFAWRFHPVPGDYFRFSHMAMEQLFLPCKPILLGYDLVDRRKDMIGFYKNKTDAVPIDALGGWRENWETVIVAKKMNKE